MENQTEAEFLAKELEDGKFTPNILQNEFALRERAAQELRRLHGVNAELLAMLQKATHALAGGLWDYGHGQDEHELCNEVIAECRAAIAKSTGPSK